MSLVNDMLRDLERRKKLPEGARRVSAAIPVHLEPDGSGRRWLLVIVLILAGIGVGVAAGYLLSNQDAGTQYPVAVNLPSAPSAQTPVAAGSTPDPAPAAVAVEERQEPVTARIASEQQQDNGFEIRFQISEEVPVEIVSRGENSINVHMAGVDNLASRYSDIEGVHLEPGDDGFNTVVELNRQSDFRVFEDIGADQYTVVVAASWQREQSGEMTTAPAESPRGGGQSPVAPPEVAAGSQDGGMDHGDSPSDPVASVTAPDGDSSAQTQQARDSTAPVRVAREPSPGERDREASREAVRMIQGGRINAAYDALFGYIAENPEAHQSRETLATLLFAQQDYRQARAVVDEGLSLAPNYAAYKTIKARLLSMNGELAAAIDLLRMSPPAVDADPEYHEILASLYQRDSRYREAIEIYQNLIRHDREQARWWAGLAISHEALGNAEQAVAGYRAALQLPGLNSSLRQYSQNRINSLGRN